jgi:signal transduction histidine kinase
LADAFNSMVDALAERIEREARFSSDVSHEMRSPLAAMAASISVVERRTGSMPVEVAEPFGLLRDQVSGFQALTLDLLEISRLDAGTVQLDLEVLDAARFATNVVASLAGEDGHRYAEVDVVHDGTALVSADKRRLRQVFDNLLSNAERYGGGADRVSVVVDEAAGTVRFAVEDRGAGVAPAERERIFGRFARGDAAITNPNVRGSGLGLSLAREHVRLHGGRIWVEDRPGGGARFVVELPIVDPDLLDAEEPG